MTALSQKDCCFRIISIGEAAAALRSQLPASHRAAVPLDDLCLAIQHAVMTLSEAALRQIATS
jgi:hypothetical protein